MIETTPELGQTFSRADGVAAFMGNYAHTGPGDRVVVLYTPESREIAALLAMEATRLGATAAPVPMRPLEDADFGDRLESALPPAIAVGERLVVVSVERDTMSHVLELRRRLSRFDQSRVAVLRIINAVDEFFTQAVRTAPETLSAINSGILNRLMPSPSVKVTSASGTDLRIDFDSDRYRWLSNRGVWREGAFLVFPAGEVSTYGSNVNGRLVADGAFNVTAYTAMDARLGENPVIMDFENGRLVDYRCDSAPVTELVRRCLEYENADRVGEIGIGTNIGIESFIAMNSHINERRPGLHIGLGQHGQKSSAVNYRCDVHLDMITTETTFDVGDGQPPIESWRLAPSPLPHPTDVDDEDIDGDCCGIFSFN